MSIASDAPRNSATNVIAVLDKAQRPLTKAEIRRLSGLSRPTVAGALSALKERGLVAEARPPDRGRHPGPGRPAAAFRLTDEAGVVLAIDIGHRSYRVAIADSSGAFVTRRRDRSALRVDQPCDVEELGPRVLTEAVAVAADLVREAAIPPRSIRGAGIGIPAPLTGGDRVAGSSYLVGWEGVEIHDAVSEALQHAIPGRSGWRDAVFVENDANLGALAHLADAASREIADFVYVKVSSGIGAGLVLDGRLYRGGRGLAGELGHMSVTPVADGLQALPGERPDALRGVVCPRCGKPDCLELAASADAMMRELRERSRTYAELQATDVIRATIEDPVNHPLANAAVAAIGRSLGYAVAQVSALFDPRLIVLGGVMADAGDRLLGPMRKVAVRQGLRLEEVPIEAAVDRRSVGLRGAVALALQETTPLFFKPRRTILR